MNKDIKKCIKLARYIHENSLLLTKEERAKNKKNKVHPYISIGMDGNYFEVSINLYHNYKKVKNSVIYSFIVGGTTLEEAVKNLKQDLKHDKRHCTF